MLLLHHAGLRIPGENRAKRDSRTDFFEQKCGNSARICLLGGDGSESVELQGRKAEHRGLAPRTPCQVRLFSKQVPRLAGRAPKWLPDVDLHHDDPLNRRTCYFDIIRE